MFQAKISVHAHPSLASISQNWRSLAIQSCDQSVTPANPNSRRHLNRFRVIRAFRGLPFHHSPTDLFSQPFQTIKILVRHTVCFFYNIRKKIPFFEQPPTQAQNEP